MNPLNAREQTGAKPGRPKATNPLLQLQEQGQAVWLDFVARGFLRSGGLAKLIAEDRLRGVTSNPAIFEKAIAESSDYDDSLKRTGVNGAHTVTELFEHLAFCVCSYIYMNRYTVGAVFNCLFNCGNNHLVPL